MPGMAPSSPWYVLNGITYYQQVTREIVLNIDDLASAHELKVEDNPSDLYELGYRSVVHCKDGETYFLLEDFATLKTLMEAGTP